MKAIVVHKTGGAEQLHYTDVAKPSVTADAVLIKNQYAGVNFIDTYLRSGLYPLELPATIGVEGAGVIVQVGSKVLSLSVGDTVVYFGMYGSYAEYSVVPAAQVITVNNDIVRDMLAVYVQGMTAHYLLHTIASVTAGSTVVVLAAAGGVGRLLCQWAHHLGASVIGVVSTDEKKEIAQAAGAAVVLKYDETPFADAVLEHTSGVGADVVFDSVGQPTIEHSIAALKTRGLLVSYGQSGGAIATVNAQHIASKSLFYTRPSLFHYLANRTELEMRAHAVSSALSSQIVTAHIHTEVPLADAATAHRLLESRKTSGKVLLVV